MLLGPRLREDDLMEVLWDRPTTHAVPAGPE